MQNYRTIIFYKDYFQEFFVKQLNKVKEKIIWTFDLIEELPRVPKTYLEYIENTEGLYEIRVQHGRDIPYILFFRQGTTGGYCKWISKEVVKKRQNRKLKWHLT